MTSLQTQESLASTLPTNLPATFMKEITADFASERELGRSVFGIVYKVNDQALTFKHQILQYKTLVLMIHGGG